MLAPARSLVASMGRSWNIAGLATPLERECFAHQTLHRGPLGVSARVERDETRILATAVQQPGAVVELPAAVEEKRRMLREGANANDVRVVNRVPRELPHRSSRPRRHAVVSDLLRFRGGGLHRPARSQDCRAHGRRDLLQVFGDRGLWRRHRYDSLYRTVL